jgi:hypothetical protein
MRIVSANENICSPALSNLEERNTPHADICQAHVTLAKHEPRQGHRDAAWVDFMKKIRWPSNSHSGR